MSQRKAYVNTLFVFLFFVLFFYVICLNVQLLFVFNQLKNGVLLLIGSSYCFCTAWSNLHDCQFSSRGAFAVKSFCVWMCGYLNIGLSMFKNGNWKNVETSCGVYIGRGSVKKIKWFSNWKKIAVSLIFQSRIWTWTWMHLKFPK